MTEARVNESRHGRVLELVIHNPAQRNALTPEISAGLTRALPPQLASELALTARPIDAARLARHGVVNRVVASGKARGEGIAAFLEKRKACFQK